MCSFDLKSLFTAVLLEKTINVCSQALFDIKGLELSLTKENFIQLLRLTTSKVEFSANSQMYKQLDGVAIGSPLGNTLTNIFLESREALLMGKTRRHLFYCRYIDYCFVVFKTEDESAQFHCHLNQVHPVQSTFVCEESYQIPYLDVMVMCKNGKILTTVYRKATFSGQYVKWNSFCNDSRKIHLVKNLTLRALRICSPSLLEL